MKATEIILFLIVTPAILFTVAILFLKSRRFLATKNQAYTFSFFSKKIIINRHDIVTVFVLVLCFSWLNIFAPFALALLIIFPVLCTFPIASFKRIDDSTHKEVTQQLIDKLALIEEEIEATRQHFSVLQLNLDQTQLEVDKRQKIKERLDAEISANKASAETWASMNEEQKKLVSQTTVTAISKKLKRDFWKGMIWGFVINILATLTWTLLGNPGKDDLVRKFNSLIELHNK